MKTYSKPELVSIIKEATHKPKLELTPNQINRLKTATDILLSIIGTAGLVMVSVVAPNALQAFNSAFKRQGHRFPFKDRQKKLARSFYYLKDRGYIKLKPKNKDFEIQLTDKAKNKIRKLKFDTLEIKKPLIWDRKFWQVAADIPVEHKKAAGRLRTKLKQIGFYSLQRTLWFYPYDPRREIELLIQEYRIDRFVTIMKIAKLDYVDDKILRDHFIEAGIIEF